MKRVLTLIVMVCALQQVFAQDFTSLLLKKSKPDTLFTQITVSPKMMHEILEQKVSEDEQMDELIANLKSLRILSSSTEAPQHFQLAVDLLEQHAKRFEPIGSYEDGENSRIAIRKKKDVIVELVMLRLDNEHFTLIDFTGTIRPEQISTLAGTWKNEKLKP